MFAGAGETDPAYLDRYYACAQAILGGEYGQPFARKAGGGPALPPGPHGETVYGRMIPHAGDGGATEPVPPGNWYVLEHSGVKIVYDRDRV